MIENRNLFHGFKENQLEKKRTLALTLSPFGGERELKHLAVRAAAGIVFSGGCQFEFSSRTIEPLTNLLREELGKL